MLKQTLALVGLTLSFSANAAIIDLGNITRDTASGLDWLDMTNTVGRSYDDISSKLGTGQEFFGWRYATVAEVESLYDSFQLDVTITVIDVPMSNSIYFNLKDMTEVMGSTLGSDSTLNGIQGITGDSNITGFATVRSIWTTLSSVCTIPNQYTGCSGYAHELDIRASSDSDWANDRTWMHMASYLVAPSAVPVPAAAWLFGSALIGLAGIKRKK